MHDWLDEEDDALITTALELMEEQRKEQNKTAARGQRAPGAGGPQYSG
ncbi:hypothetical protein [Amycolatopsis sp. YIM 10]|nr:hypothetical protein [Amycolatopsis sp. YIM 10]QFU87881.1 hypothetical protein YIM_13475 [Amycolatopsis sp. YIM 10]QFU94806.1 hypothetical protein YIM_48405 [Amycolatopsis sp. YIM 10]